MREIRREEELRETRHTSSFDLGQADTSLPPPKSGDGHAPFPASLRAALLSPLSLAPLIYSNTITAILPVSRGTEREDTTIIKERDENQRKRDQNKSF